MHEKMFHSIEDSAEITVTIKLITSCNAEHKVKLLNKETSDTIVIKQQTSCNAEHKEKHVNKETSAMIVIDYPNPNPQCSKRFWNITLTSTLHDKQAALQSVVAGGSVIGEAAYAALEYSLTVEVPRVSRARMLVLFISTKHLHWIVAAEL